MLMVGTCAAAGRVHAALITRTYEFTVVILDAPGAAPIFSSYLYTVAEQVSFFQSIIGQVRAGPATTSAVLEPETLASPLGALAGALALWWQVREVSLRPA